MPSIGSTDSKAEFSIKYGEDTEDYQVLSPRGIAVAPDGSGYVADAKNHFIQKFNKPNLENVGAVFPFKWGTEGTGDGEFKTPHGVAVAYDGSVYVADTSNNRIQKFTSQGAFVISRSSVRPRGGSPRF